MVFPYSARCHSLSWYSDIPPIGGLSCDRRRLSVGTGWDERRWKERVFEVYSVPVILAARPATVDTLGGGDG